MVARLQVVHELALLFLVLLLNGFIVSCTPAIPLVTPPETYKGPVAESPALQQGDYWVYQRGNLTKVKTTALPANVGFPLWIGKTWSYEGQATRIGQSPTGATPRIPTRIDCHVTAFKQMTVAAGIFEAFECECQCTVPSAGAYETGCNTWTIWYAPEVKNIIRTKTVSSATSAELVEYKASRPAPGTKVTPEKTSVSPESKFEPNALSSMRALSRGEIGEALVSYEFQAQEAETSHPYFWAPFILLGDGK